MIVETGEIFRERPVVHVETFPGDPDNEWDGYANAMEMLKRMGYIEGSMERAHPIGFAPKGNHYYISKWNNMDPGDRRRLHGVMWAPDGDWRHGQVQIVWWELPIESPVGQITFESV